MERKSLVGISICAVVLLVIISSNGAVGQTIYVDDDNTHGPWDGTLEHPYRTVTAAYEIASDRDKIFVFNGNYGSTQNLILEKSLTLQGENMSSTKLRMTIHVKKDNTIIKNFTQISYGSSSWGIGIWSNWNIIQNNIIISESNGVQILGGKYNLIKNNIFKNCSNSGVSIFEGHTNIIKKNTFYNNRKGVDIFSVSNNIILNNIISKNLDCGIENDGTNNIIVGNTLSHNDHFGINIKGTKNIIYRNTISQSYCGIFISTGGNLIVSNNLLYNNLDASFEYHGYQFTIWLRNYWDKPNVLPEPILGKAIFHKLTYPFESFTIPWMNFDIRPRLLPVMIT